MKTIKFYNFLSVICMSLASVSTLSYQTEDHSALANSVIREQFNYIPQVQIQNLVDNKRCKAGRLDYTTTLNQTGEAYQVSAKIFIPHQREDKAHEKRSIVFILPTIKGGQKLAGLVDHHAALSFCHKNFISVLIENDFTGLSTGTPLAISESDLSIRRVVATLKGGTQIAINNLNVDSNKVALFGASLGGILGTTAYGLMDEIKAGSFIVAGGDLPHILTHSDQKPIIKVKQQVMAQNALETDEQYEAYLQEYLKFDPLDFASFIEDENIKLYLSMNDKSVPSVDQLKLYNELQKPEETRFYKRPGHAVTIFKVLVFSRQKKHIADWFNERFDEQ